MSADKVRPESVLMDTLTPIFQKYGCENGPLDVVVTVQCKCGRYDCNGKIALCAHFPNPALGAGDAQ